MDRQTTLAVAALVSLLGAADVRAATVYDSTAQFSAVSGNPNGVWSYGYSLSGGTSYNFVQYDVNTTSGWWSSTLNVLGTPSIWKNTGTNTQFGVAPGQVSLHPGPNSYNPSVLRFSAPSSGLFSVSAQFLPGDYGDMNAAVVLDGDDQAPVWYSGTTNNSPVYSGSFNLTMGETLDFLVGNNGSFAYGNTPVDVSVSAVPLPAALPMFGAALMGLGGLAYRRKADRAA